MTETEKVLATQRNGAYVPESKFCNNDCGPAARASLPQNMRSNIVAVGRWVLAAVSIACGIDPVLLVPPGFWPAYFSVASQVSIQPRFRGR